MSDPTVFRDISKNLTVRDDWEGRYRYLIELGHGLPRLTQAEELPGNGVHGWVSQVWLVAEARRDNGQTVRIFRGESDAMIVRGSQFCWCSIPAARRRKSVK
ncbi:SufE family protein [Devosia sp. ZW T5_3]|uniref:SufE family protein n=1 Tax=Devosia sp. ZW T5_3 TaxID=3378085 RepID=UPI003854D5C9